MFKGDKKWLWLIGFIIIILLGVMVYLDAFSGGKNVGFTAVEQDNIPREIVQKVIPQYRNMERALATKVGDKVYVMVSRGEKPTSGYKISVEKMKLEQAEGKTNLVVYAFFKDPEGARGLSQMVTYPIQIVETSLEGLPDQVELRIEFAQE